MIKLISNALHTWRATSRTANQLARLSDDQLRDIGLSRQDIPFVVRRRPSVG